MKTDKNIAVEESLTILLEGIEELSSKQLYESEEYKEIDRKISKCQNMEEVREIIDLECVKNNISLDQLENFVKTKSLFDRKIPNLRTLLVQVLRDKTKLAQSSLELQTSNKRITLNVTIPDAVLQKENLTFTLEAKARRILSMKDKNVFLELFDYFLLGNNSFQAGVRNNILEKDIIGVVQLLKSLSDELKENKSLDTILKDLLKSTYLNILLSSHSESPQRDHVDIQQLVDAISKLDFNHQNINQKEIIAFLGNTGAGKSTSVNYLLGVPLERFINNLGEESVQICKKECDNLKNIKIACIGDALGISETHKATTYEVIKSNQPTFSSNNILLCDIPGFCDTRGAMHDILAAISTDFILNNCKEIKSVVLVIPYQTFLLDRINHLIELFDRVKNIFPNINNQKSKARNSLYILITKYQNQLQKDKYRSRLIAHISEESTRVTQMQRNGFCNDALLVDHRISIFQLLLENFDRGKTDFIDVNDNFERDIILEKYASSQSIVLTEYKGFLNAINMQTGFMQNFVTKTKAITDEVILPFFVEINQNLALCKNRESEQKLLIAKNQREKLEKEELMKFIMQATNQTRKKSNYLLSNPHEVESKQDLFETNENNDLDELIKIEKDLKRNIDRNEVEIKNHTDSLEETSSRIEHLSQSIENSNRKINQLSLGSSRIEIFNMTVNLMDKITYNVSTTEEDIEYALKNFLEIPSPNYQLTLIETMNAYRIGKEIDLVRIVEFPYSVIPPHCLDTISKLNGRLEFRDHEYRQTINASGIQLKAINFKECGRVLALHLKLNFKSFNKSIYLMVTHTIPNSEINKASINSEIANVKICSYEIKNLEKGKKKIQKKIDTRLITREDLGKKSKTNKAELIQAQDRVAKRKEVTIMQQKKEDLYVEIDGLASEQFTLEKNWLEIGSEINNLNLRSKRLKIVIDLPFFQKEAGSIASFIDFYFSTYKNNIRSLLSEDQLENLNQYVSLYNKYLKVDLIKKKYICN